MEYLLRKKPIKIFIITFLLAFIINFIAITYVDETIVYAYLETPFNYISSWDTDSYNNFIFNTRQQLLRTGKVSFKYYTQIGHVIVVSSGYEYYQYNVSDGSVAYYHTSTQYEPQHGEINIHDSIMDVPSWLLESLSLEHIMFSQINNTISFKNDNVMGKNITIFHEGYTNPTGSVSSSIKFEIYDNNNNIVKVLTPDNISDSTVLNLPYTNSEYYYINVINPTIYQPNFYTLYQSIDFHLPSMQLELGQAYKVVSTDVTKSLTFANQLPDQLYIYKEYIDGTYDIFNHSPSGSIPSLIETKDIIFMSTSSDVVETYFVIVDSIHHNHSVTTSSLNRSDILKVDSIPYVPDGVSEIWENLETGIPGIGDVDFKIDMGVESMDTSKDELLFENKSGQNMTLAFETSGSNVVFVPQKKMLDENMQYYWTDISVNSLSSDKVYTLSSNRRVIVQVYQGVLDFKYPLEYISGSKYIDYVHGVDYVLQVKHDVHGNNPTAEDGTGLINNPNSDISYTSPDDFNISDYFGDSTNDNISINNPYENVGIGGSIPTIPQVYDSISGIMSSAVAFVGIFTGIFNMFPAPLPAMFTLVVFSIPLFLFLKIVGR